MKIQAPRDEKHRKQLQRQLALSTPAPPGHRYRVRIAEGRFGWVAHFRLVPLDSIRSHKKAKSPPGKGENYGAEGSTSLLRCAPIPPP